MSVEPSRLDPMEHAADWVCECGARPGAASSEWRYNGRDWEHYHGYPIGHLPATYKPAAPGEKPSAAGSPGPATTPPAEIPPEPPVKTSQGPRSGREIIYKAPNQGADTKENTVADGNKPQASPPPPHEVRAWEPAKCLEVVCGLRFYPNLGRLYMRVAKISAGHVLEIGPEIPVGSEPIELKLPEAAPLAAEVEQLRVQLAGVLTAAEGHTSDPAKEGDYGWSLAYQKTLELRRRFDAIALRCPPEVESATGTFDHSGAGAGGDMICAGCGCHRGEHLPPPPAPVDEHKVGLYNKYFVSRNDGSSGPGGKHENCQCFVLDLDHDPHAKPALLAYADACAKDYPLLATDLRALALLERASLPKSSTPPAPSPGKAYRGDWIDRVILDIAELPDRTSPEDAPERMLVTAEELRDIIESHLRPENPSAKPEECQCELRDRAWDTLLGKCNTCGKPYNYPAGR